MKKIINNPNDVVSECLKGMALAHPSLKYTPRLEVISRQKKIEGKVGVISGGGSGHEPAHAGYVGCGMLDAAVAGNMFSSPDPERIIRGIKEADGGSGVLMIIKNYSGDVMNFEMAADMAGMDGIRVESVVVRDDVAVPDSTYSTGRRGISGTVFVHKIAGAAAEKGYSIDQVKMVAQKAGDKVRSMGMAMTPCILPAVGKPGFTLGEEEVEIGMGIHGEPGVARTDIKTARQTADILLEKILADMDFTNSEVALMVNGLGGTPLMELYILNNEVRRVLDENGVTVYKTFVGNYMTAIEMAGCSISLLRLDDELKMLLDAPCNTPYFKSTNGR